MWSELFSEIMSFFRSDMEATKVSSRDNRLSGPIPGAVAALANLQILDLCENRLSSTIPHAVIHWTEVPD